MEVQRYLTPVISFPHPTDTTFSRDHYSCVSDDKIDAIEFQDALDVLSLDFHAEVEDHDASTDDWLCSLAGSSKTANAVSWIIFFELLSHLFELGPWISMLGIAVASMELAVWAWVSQQWSLVPYQVRYVVGSIPTLRFTDTSVCLLCP
jgi:hypothetical protein